MYRASMHKPFVDALPAAVALASSIPATLTQLLPGTESSPAGIAPAWQWACEWPAGYGSHEPSADLGISLPKEPQ